jgi:hypothetical protein
VPSHPVELVVHPCMTFCVTISPTDCAVAAIEAGERTAIPIWLIHAGLHSVPRGAQPNRAG